MLRARLAVPPELNGRIRSENVSDDDDDNDDNDKGAEAYGRDKRELDTRFSASIPPSIRRPEYVIAAEELLGSLFRSGSTGKRPRSDADGARPTDGRASPSTVKRVRRGV
jgi:hypothetical protein